MRKAKIKNKLRGKFIRMLTDWQKKISAGVHPYPVSYKQKINHKKSK